MSPTPQPPTVNLPIRLAGVLAVGLLGACQPVRDFIIPPPSAGSARLHQQRERRWAHLVLRGVRCDDPAIDTVAIRGGLIIAAGREHEVARWIGPGTHLLDVSKGYLRPGFVDAHVHLDGMAMTRGGVALARVAESGALGAALRSAGRLRDPGEWIWAYGAGHALLGTLDADRLARLAPGVPTWISAADGHCAVLSRALLELLPAAARTLVHGARGRACGVTARSLWRLLPAPSNARLKPLLVQALHGHLASGYTEGHTMGATLDTLAMLISLDKEGRLGLRVGVYLDIEAPGVRRYLAGRARRRRARSAEAPSVRGDLDLLEDRSPLVRVLGVKLWLDGTLGARTAALARDYADAKGHRGRLLYDEEQLRATLATTDAAGLQLAVHAIGDAAAERLARAIAAERPAGAFPVRIEHAQVVDPGTLGRLAAVAAVCVVQPLQELDDAPFCTARLGPARRPWAYRRASLAKVCPLAASSDAPVSAARPFAMLERMIAPGPERMSASAALGAMSMDVLRGKPRSIIAGAPADLVLWSRRLAPGAAPSRAAPPRPWLVLVDGETIYLAPTLPKMRAAPTLTR